MSDDIDRRSPGAVAMHRIADLALSETVKGNATSSTIFGALGTIPYVGSLLATWLGEAKGAKYKERVLDVLWKLSDAIGTLEARQESLRLDHEYAELVEEMLLLAAKCRLEEKRAKFARLLANAAREEKAEKRDDARTMGLLLDQLEYSEVQVLRRLVVSATAKGSSTLWGSYRTVNVAENNQGVDGVLEIRSPSEGRALLRLHGLGLIRSEAFRQRQDFKEVCPIEIVDLGMRLFNWTALPEEQVAF